MSSTEDKELDNYLQGGSDLSQAYSELADEPVPDGLDNQILAAAKTSQETSTPVKPRLAGRSLDSPFAMAAVLFLCVSLVLVFSTHEQSYDEIPSPTESIPIDSSAAEAPALEQDTFSNVGVEQVSPEPLMPSEGVTATVADDPAVSSQQEVKQKTAARSKSSVVIADKEMLEISVEADDISRLPEEKTLKKETNALADSITIDKSAANIVRLLNANNVSQAQQAFQTFVKHYPDVNLTDWFTEQQLNSLNIE